jgi:hypothetical protein
MVQFESTIFSSLACFGEAPITEYNLLPFFSDVNECVFKS